MDKLRNTLRFLGTILILLQSFQSAGNTVAAPPADTDPTAYPASSTQYASAPTLPANADLAIWDITTNASDYAGGQIPRHEKFEITFQVDTNAQNLQLPYDPAPPPGLPAGIGISVDAYFTPDNWQTVYRQPAFYFQEFEDRVVNNNEWYYPTGNFAWKVRFAPHQAGEWQYKIVAQDASGVSESPVYTFSVSPSQNKGFIRVSQRDSRYFEFENGRYFPALSYNMNFNHVDWDNPVLDNQGNFQIMSQNGIQLIRIWLSQWGIYGPSWNPWNAIDPNLHAQYIPYSGLTFNEAYPGSEVSMQLNAGYNPCMFIGFMKAPPAVKPNTSYRVRIRYKTVDLTGPRVAGEPYGLVAKTGGWLWGDGNYCQDPGTGSLVTPHQSQNTSGWQILEGQITTGNTYFLPNFYLVLENVNAGRAYIDYVWIEEDYGDGSYGPNIVSKPWMAHHYYMEQRNSYAFDKLLELAEQYEIYLRPVIHEKNEYIFNRIDYEGNPIPGDPACWDADPDNDPEKCPGNNWFYGNWRQVTKVRWLQQAWWRYLQARWGYSTSIHSWELLNEGDPWNGLHYTLADEFAKYMHQFQPNHHLVSTSFWHSFPRDSFWTNPEYQNVDFADYHRYIGSTETGFLDAAQATVEVSTAFGAREPGGAGKPIIRGETGFVVSGSGPATDQFERDTEGVWLHNFVWGGINPGGLIESYWYENVHIYKVDRGGNYFFDHRDKYGSYYNFIKDIQLNNGYYQDAAASYSSGSLRVLGQKDLHNGRAHLWIQNTQHTWKNVVDGQAITPVSDSISISGFVPGLTYLVEWWDPYAKPGEPAVVKSQVLTAAPDGTLDLAVNNLLSDIAVRLRVKVFSDKPIYLPLINAGQ